MILCGDGYCEIFVGGCCGEYIGILGGCCGEYIGICCEGYTDIEGSTVLVVTTTFGSLLGIKTVDVGGVVIDGVTEIASFVLAASTCDV